MNEELMLSALERAGAVARQLVKNGATLRGISVHDGRPVIRIQRCGYSDRLIESGVAFYQNFGCGPSGPYKQGAFMVDGCKVVWSESLH
ncbi:hypothetical protein [Leminorella grimontii]|uniref:hypothetical protein n=1 Tax=Leminorella grimontii TaxID=82981 RepID=UPI00321FDFE5